MRLGSLALASVQRHDAHGTTPTAPELKIGNNWGEPSAWFGHQGAGNVGDGTSRRRLVAFLFFFRTLLTGLGFLGQTPWHSVSWGRPSLWVKQTARFDAIRRGSDGASALWPGNYPLRRGSEAPGALLRRCHWSLLFRSLRICEMR